MAQEPSSRDTSPGMPGGPSDGLGGTAQAVTEQAKDTAGQVVDQARDTAGQAAEQAKRQATSQIESQKERAVDALVTVAQALRQTGQHLHEHEQPAVGGYVEQAAERVENLTHYLRVRDVAALVAETQDLARRKPGLFLTGAVALGFIGARFLRSSGQRSRTQGTTRAMLPASTGSGYTPMIGYPGGQATQSRAPSAASAAAANLGVPGYASLERPEHTGTFYHPSGSAGAPLEP